jgi:hypothetical protein
VQFEEPALDEHFAGHGVFAQVVVWVVGHSLAASDRDPRARRAQVLNA